MMLFNVRIITKMSVKYTKKNISNMILFYNNINIKVIKIKMKISNKIINKQMKNKMTIIKKN